MIIFKELITGDELFTDADKRKEVDDGIFIELEGKLTTERTEVNDAMFGGNKSAEATGEEDAEGSSVSGVNIVIQNRLEEIHYVDKKLYKKYLKLYVARIIDHITETNPDYLPKFQTNVKKAVARIIETFDDWQFFRGPTDIDYMNKEKAEGMLALLGYRDGSKPYMLFFKDGLIEEKA